MNFEKKTKFSSAIFCQNGIARRQGRQGTRSLCRLGPLRRIRQRGLFYTVLSAVLPALSSFLRVSWSWDGA